MKRLKYRMMELGHERATGSFTSACSRRDLLEIARMLPMRDEWCESAFAHARACVMKRFGLSGREFSKAVEIIERNREMRCIIGRQSELAHLSDQKMLFVIDQWTRRHANKYVIDTASIDAKAMIADRHLASDVNRKILEVLSPDEIVDLEAIYYIGRDGEFCEHYERDLDLIRENHRSSGDLVREVDHLMTKTNFQEATAKGVSKLGRPDLASSLLEIKIGATTA